MKKNILAIGIIFSFILSALAPMTLGYNIRVSKDSYNNLIKQVIERGIISNNNWGEQDKLLPSDGETEDSFGISVSISGDYALVGTHWDDDNGNNSGSAYVFIRSSFGWTEQTKLLPSDGADGDQFGCSVSIDGDTALIGANGDNDNGNYTGSAYIFTRSDTVWTEQAKLLASDGVTGDSFGRSVSIDSDTALIGAMGDGDNGFQSGSAYIFTRSDTVWSEQAKLLASDGEEFDWFSFSASIDGDTALIGALGNDDFMGSAYIFTRSGTSWTEEAKLLASDGKAGDMFGVSVSIDGDTALIGAYCDDDNGVSSGSAYIFNRSGTFWSEQAKLLASDGATSDYFGLSVAIDGDTAIIGAPGNLHFPTEPGSTYIFIRFGTIWTEQAKLLSSDGAVGDYFGFSVSIDESYAIIGAPLDDDNGNDSGSAYIFTSENLPPDTPTITGPSTGKPNIEYDFSFNSTDPNDDAVMYTIDWGDNNTEWTEYGNSGEEIILKHIWSEKGTFTIKAKAKDINGAESPWGELEVNMPRNKAIHTSLIYRILEQFPLLNLLLQKLTVSL